MNIDRQRLMARIGHTFNQHHLLDQALTHRSHSALNNERLEFLGDAALGFIVGEALYRKYADLDEGQLTRLRASLVRGETLAEIARAMDIGEHLRLGQGELNSGGHRRSSILADALEAIIGAIYLDAGMAGCKSCVLDWFSDRIENAQTAAVAKDPKTTLQELMQARGLELPVYAVERVEGEQHSQQFLVRCEVELLPEPVFGEGASRKVAEKQAAKRALKKIEAVA